MKGLYFLIIILCSIKPLAADPSPCLDSLIEEKALDLSVKLHLELSWASFPSLIKEVRSYVNSLNIFIPHDKHELIHKIVARVIDITDTPYLPDSISDPFLKALVEPMVLLYDWIDTGSFTFLDPSISQIKTFDDFAQHLKSIFNMQFELKDLILCLKFAYNFILTFPSLSAAEQKHAIIEILDIVIDYTDTPYLPDFIFDPIFKALVPPLVDEVFYLLHLNLKEKFSL